jgi:hypothetical protein
MPGSSRSTSGGTFWAVAGHLGIPTYRSDLPGARSATSIPGFPADGATQTRLIYHRLAI